MEVVIALTLLLSFGAFLFFPTVHAPPLFSRVAIALCGAEFGSLLVWAAGRECVVPGCPQLSRAAWTVASFDIPALTMLMFVAAIAYGLRVARSWYQFPDADPRHRRTREGRRGHDPQPDRSRP